MIFISIDFYMELCSAAKHPKNLVFDAEKHHVFTSKSPFFIEKYRKFLEKRQFFTDFPEQFSSKTAFSASLIGVN